MKIRLFSFLLLILLGQKLAAQEINLSGKIHAHNNYVQPIPFLTTYHQQVGSLEADVFLRNGELYVAHTLTEIQPEQTLENLYLKPMQLQVIKNEGTVYRQPTSRLQFLIDLKTDGKITLPALIRTLDKYSEIIDNPSIRIVISGDKPAPDSWAQFPAFINFDGTPGQKYIPDQLLRVALVSDSFLKYTQWNGMARA